MLYCLFASSNICVYGCLVFTNILHVFSIGFSNQFLSLLQKYDPELFRMALPCLSAIAGALPPDYLDTRIRSTLEKQISVDPEGNFDPKPVNTAKWVMQFITISFPYIFLYYSFLTLVSPLHIKLAGNWILMILLTVMIVLIATLLLIEKWPFK